MPLRSPKMYFCIFGFQRLVWWPKCTPASRSSFIVNVAMIVASPFGLPPIPSGSTPRGSALPRPMAGTEARNRACYWCGVATAILRRVLRVDPYVLLGEIRGPHVILAPAEPEVDDHRIFPLTHDVADPFQPSVRSRRPPIDEWLVPDGDPHTVSGDARGRLAERHHDASPVGVGAVERRFDER